MGKIKANEIEKHDASQITVNSDTHMKAGTTLSVDTIAEKTSAAGVTIDGVKLKDNIVETDTINEKTSAAGVTIDGVLIKDGLVDGKDVSALSGGGLVHISTDTFSTVTSFAKDSVFSATYDIYKIFITMDTTNNANVSLNFEMRGSSSNVTSNYVGNRWYQNIGATSFTFADTGTSSWYIADPGGSDPNRFGAEITLFNPASAEDTLYRSIAQGPYASAYYSQASYGYNTNNTAYDGFNLNCASTQMTGKVSTYGLALS